MRGDGLFLATRIALVSLNKVHWLHFAGAVDKLTGASLTVNYTHFLLKANHRTSLLPHGTGTKTDSQSASLKYLAATTVMLVCAECDPY